MLPDWKYTDFFSFPIFLYENFQAYSKVEKVT